MQPIGVTDGGEIVFTTSPQAARAVELFAQLQAWRDKGYYPMLHSGRDGWHVVIDSGKWMDGVSDRTQQQVLRFATDSFSTPQAAIEAALKVVQP